MLFEKTDSLHALVEICGTYFVTFKTSSRRVEFLFFQTLPLSCFFTKELSLCLGFVANRLSVSTMMKQCWNKNRVTFDTLSQFMFSFCLYLSCEGAIIILACGRLTWPGAIISFKRNLPCHTWMTCVIMSICHAQGLKLRLCRRGRDRKKTWIWTISL